MGKTSVAISLTEGRVVRDLLCNGLLQMLKTEGVEVHLLSPSGRVPEFIEAWSQPGVNIHLLKPYQLTGLQHRVLQVRKRMITLGRLPLQQWLKVESRFFPADRHYLRILRENRCRLVVVTHPMFHSEMELFSSARVMGLPTLGVLRSWDNLYKGLRIRPDVLAVWNMINREEACRMLRYREDCVPVVGGTQFDPYFAPDARWSRERLAASFGLDPARPIITLATLGSFFHLYDESYLMDFLIDAIAKTQIKGSPQLICRLHPASRLEWWTKYGNITDVRFSYINGYVPGMGWTMSRQDVIEVANILRHSDVVVSPGSTITIETAIFDTPTIVPVFHTYQPELGALQFQQHLATHFRRIKELDLVPIVDEPDTLVGAINHALNDRSWYREQRKRLVADYIHFTDGRSTERLAQLIIRLAAQGVSSRTSKQLAQAV